mmetsp:Transcript_48159/g.113656  ORF Transcript_48159/g.113656 Transcript_48159/m.113656 type:complete len:211 (-) Transcript_48159:158-790(-)
MRRLGLDPCQKRYPGIPDCVGALDGLTHHANDKPRARRGHCNPGHARDKARALQAHYQRIVASSHRSLDHSVCCHLFREAPVDHLVAGARHAKREDSAQAPTRDVREHGMGDVLRQTQRPEKGGHECHSASRRRRGERRGLESDLRVREDLKLLLCFERPLIEGDGHRSRSGRPELGGRDDEDLLAFLRGQVIVAGSCSAVVYQTQTAQR